MSHNFQAAGFRQDDDTANRATGLSSPAQHDLSFTQYSSPSAAHMNDAAGLHSKEEPEVVSKKRRPPGNDHVKHRRTRNGCYTCRGRRVKVCLLSEVQQC